MKWRIRSHFNMTKTTLWSIFFSSYARCDSFYYFAFLSSFCRLWEERRDIVLLSSSWDGCLCLWIDIHRCLIWIWEKQFIGIEPYVCVIASSLVADVSNWNIDYTQTEWVMKFNRFNTLSIFKNWRTKHAQLKSMKVLVLVIHTVTVHSIQIDSFRRK